jgi:hypothetical protein
LIKLFDVDLNQFVSGLLRIKVNPKTSSDDLQVDFTFMDKVLTHMVGLQKNDLLELLKQYDDPKDQFPP